MKQRIWAHLRRLLGYRRLIVPCEGRGRITVDERCLIQRQILVSGSYEPEVWQALSEFVVSDEVVWDVGAHIGSVAIRALVDPRVKEVHAFEPDPVHAAILATNLALNGGRHSVHRCALSSQREVRKLFHGPLANSGLSSLVDPVGDEAYEVECRTADELIFQDGCDPPTLMKVDVEGWESEVLRGATRLLSASPPKAIVFETERDEEGGVADALLSGYFEGFGYAIRHIPRPSGLVDRRENFLAVPRRPFRDGP